MQNKDLLLHASEDPISAINAVTYNGQLPKMRQYKTGFEDWMNIMPRLYDEDPMLQSKVNLTYRAMQELAENLRGQDWISENRPLNGEFDRVIIAIEGALPEESVFVDERGQRSKEGTELLVARWGDGFSSPVHGHAPGYLHEEILTGKVIVNTYKAICEDCTIARLISSQIVEKGTFLSAYHKENPRLLVKRPFVVHNFKSIGYSTTLHYVPEHTRDGRDNKFSVEYFEVAYGLQSHHLTRKTATEAFYSKIGTVYLVRSSNVPELGDHFIVITGVPVVKPHGTRPQDVALVAPYAKKLLNEYEDDGLVLLQLNEDATKAFLKFHSIKIEDGKVIFPQP